MTEEWPGSLTLIYTTYHTHHTLCILSGIFLSFSHFYTCNFVVAAAAASVDTAPEIVAADMLKHCSHN